jgi:hypothetical protein
MTFKIKNISQLFKSGLIALVVLTISANCVKAANVVFTFAQTTANGMDLFAAPGGALISNSTSPNVFFALGYVASGYDFTSKTRQNLINDITIIASSSSSWTGVGTAGASAGGKANVNFDNGGTGGFNTTTYAGSKLVAIVSQGVNPLGGSIIDTTPLAIVRGGSAWDAVVAPDASPNPVTQSLNVADFSSILVGSYAALVGNVNSTGTTKFDTITLNAIPEPTTSSMVIFAAMALLAANRKRGERSRA